MKFMQVVAKIKAVPHETRLLVVDDDSDKYFTDKGIKVTSSMDAVQVIVSPDADSHSGELPAVMRVMECFSLAVLGRSHISAFGCSIEIQILWQF